MSRAIRELRRSVSGYLFIMPSISIFLVFFFFPIVYTLFLSLHDWSGITPPNFQGLANYRELLHDHVFRMAIRNTIVYTLMFVPLVSTIPLLIAVALNAKIRFRNLFRLLYFIPVTCSTIIAAVIWKWVYHGDVGVLNYLLSLVGIRGRMWLGDPQVALAAIAAMSVWKLLGYYMVLYLAGLQSIPTHLYEAAKIDGASSLDAFFRLTIPLLRPVILLVVVIATIDSFKAFDAIYVMTLGGPMRATTTLVYQIYVAGFHQFRMGYASAMGFLLFVIVFAISVIELRVLRARFEY